MNNFIISKVFSLFLLFVIPAITKAQNSFLPQNLGDNVNTFYAEINPVISPDGKTLYFTKVIPPYGIFEWEKQEIWFAELQPEGVWGKAVRMPENLNIGRYNAVLAVSGDGQTLLINGVYNKKGNIWKKRGLSTVTKNDNSWSAPERLRIPKYSKMNKGLKSNAFMSHDGNYLLLAFSKRYNGKKMDIWVSKKNGSKWSKPKRLGKTINTSRSEEAPFILSDNKTLYFTRQSGKGNADVYVSTRTKDSWKAWSKPQKMSDTINSSKWDSYFKTNSKGSFGYFSSENNSKGMADLFVVKLFEENPYVLIKGTIINSAQKKPLSKKYSFKILVDNKVIDTLRINSDSATYSVKLPFGKSYKIAASLANFTSKQEFIDATSYKEFTTLNKDLYVKPLPYVLISGKALLKGTNEPIPFNSNPKIVVNGVVRDSVKIDPMTGDYVLQLPYGEDYKIKIKADKHNSVTENLDLSLVDEYKEVPLHLYAELIKEKVATITGYVYDKKTNQPLSKSIPFKIFVNGEEFGNLKIDSINSTYSLSVPLTANYTLNASASDYYPIYETINLSQETESIKVMKDLYIVPIEVGQSVRLNNIFFASGKTTLKKESFEELDRVVQFLKENENIVIEIAGHTDNVGSAPSNMQLSLGRAKAVSNYITSKGVGNSQISFKGYGVTKPVANNKTAEGRGLNRRVEFTILDK